MIGRNEGQRLIRCLQSLDGQVDYAVYVDSGSTDSSLQEARLLGVETVSLDLSRSFTAARARNEGAEYLKQKYTDLKYIQFIDGDCEMQSDWIVKASEFLEKNADYAVACGRRRERYPERAIYNRLCDMEWNTPIGDALACGGDALIRSEAFNQVNGFKHDLIAGEEPEMCFRLRQNGWKIRRMDAEMTLHDAAMTRFCQWWKRSMRAGYAFAEGAYLHGESPERYWVKESRSIWFWGGLIPALIGGAIVVKGVSAGTILLVYPLQVARLSLLGNHEGNMNKLRAFFLVAGKFPEMLGQLQFLSNRLLGRNGRLIEYK